MRLLRLIAFPVPAAQFSECTAGAACQVDGDCPGPQEVLAKKPACSFIGKVSPGLRLLPSSPSGSGCLSPEGDGLQLAISVPSFVLCTVLAVSYVRAFRVIAIPQSGMIAQVSLLWLHSGHSAPLPSPCLLVADAGVCSASLLVELLLGSQSVGSNYLFIFPPGYVALCASKAHHRLRSESVSWCLETSLFLRLPSQDAAPSLPLLSLFLSFIFFPTCF